MHIFFPQYTWLFIYSTLLVMFLIHSVFNRFIKQDIIPALVLTAMVILQLPFNIITHFASHNLTQIQEIALFVCSFALITLKYLKKLLFYFFCSAFYFTMLSIAHISRLEYEIVPLCSLIFIYSLYATHNALPNACPTKNNKYFIIILILIVQNVTHYAMGNKFYLTLYAIFALYLALRAYFNKFYHHKIFYTFFAFFMLTVSHIFLEIYIVSTVQYTILYSTVAYFIYSTIGIQYKKYVNWVFIAQTILALLHICYTIINPSYFLLSKIESQTINIPVVGYIITFAYFTIFLSILTIIIKTLTLPRTKKNNKVAKTIYTALALLLLVEIQIIHSKVYESSEITYSLPVVSFALQIFGLATTFGILKLLEFLLIKYKSKVNINFNWNKYKMQIQKGIARFQIREYHTNFVLFILHDNTNIVHKSVITIVPVFLLFYLIIALIY